MTKMGRPPKKKSEVKEETLTLRLTRLERRAADGAARRAGVAISEWARLAIVAALSESHRAAQLEETKNRAIDRA
jgi:hypothetical protein